MWQILTSYEFIKHNVEENRAVRKSTLFMFVTSINIILILLLMLHSWISLRTAEAFLRPSADLARELQLTDLCLFTEARYTRNPSLADLHTAVPGPSACPGTFPLRFAGDSSPRSPRGSMNRSLERHRNIMDFSLSSLARRKGKNISLLLAYILLVFLLASVMFFTHALKNEASRVLNNAPEIVVQRMEAGGRIWSRYGISTSSRPSGAYTRPAAGSGVTIMTPVSARITRSWSPRLFRTMTGKLSSAAV